jgi:NhaP-type Na+/H+ or K+/H+ antiporter
MTTPLSFLTWLAIAGVGMMAMALSSAYLRRLPISTAAVYLLLGLAMGPWGFGSLQGDVPHASAWFERSTEIAVIISLFVGGLKLRQPLRAPVWGAAFRLAGPVMLGTILGVALFAHVVFGLAPAAALLLASILAPTDPVLASAVSVTRAADRDRLRYGLSGEAGLNDGLAFPFVMFALAWETQGSLGAWVGGWALQYLLWAVPAGLLLGFALGQGVGRLAVRLRSQQRDNDAPTDFLALALIALSYVAAEKIGALGFLATFAAGVGLRHAELTVVAQTPHPQAASSLADRQTPASGTRHPPAEELVPATVTADHIQEPAVAAGVLVAETISFGGTAERLLEVSLVVLVGASLVTHWDVRALLLAGFCFVIVRPLLTQALLRTTPTTDHQRWLLGWFGVRGIGSLYYVSYSLRHGLSGQHASMILDLTISVVAISIVLHGVTAQPLLSRYELARAHLRAKRMHKLRAPAASASANPSANTNQNATATPREDAPS